MASVASVASGPGGLGGPPAGAHPAPDPAGRRSGHRQRPGGPLAGATLDNQGHITLARLGRDGALETETPAQSAPAPP